MLNSITETLVLTGAIMPQDLQAAMATVGDGEQLSTHLLETNQITATQLAHAVAAARDLPYTDLTSRELDPEIIGLVPSALCRRYQLIPLERRRRTLMVGMVEPADLIAMDDIQRVTDLTVEPVVVSIDGLRQAFERYLRSDEELSDLSEQIGEAAGPGTTAHTESLDDGDADAPIVRFVNLLITQAINDRASDIHIEPGERQLMVRFRIDGVLHEMQRADASIQDGVISRLKIMASIDIAERRRPQDGRISVSHEGRQVDLRVATLPTVWGEKVVMRILDNSGQALAMSDLRFGANNEARFREAISRPHGMVLVTGPTGSGKSTTLYTALAEVANPRVNVITVEDPVEYRIPGVSQVQVNQRAGLTFQAALRSILRSDPDIVLVGEIRDHETANIAVEAALTGHLLLSTLHTNDAPSAITRLIEIGCEPFLVATALSAVVAQRLARKLCAKCRVPAHEPERMLHDLGFPYDPSNPPQMFKPGGCPTCSGTGYRGRIALHEVMVLSEEIQHMVVTHATATSIREVAMQQGMTSLRTDGWSKVAQGLTTIEEVMRVTI